MKYAPEQVFKPGSFPNLTYVSRYSDWEDTTYEDRLQIALKMSGFLTYIAGTSKMGKTILCNKVVPEGLISISGADFHSPDEFWTEVARRAEMPVEGSYISTNKTSAGETTISNRFTRTKDEVISYFIKNNLTLLIDDFHYADEDIRKAIAQQLKDAIGKEFRAIVVSLPHRADEAIRLNPDLSGRISVINLQPWKNVELKAIASSGFDKLGIDYSDELLSYLAQESLSSPQLIQSICLNIGLLLDKDGSMNGAVLSKPTCVKAFRRTTSNFEYRDVASLLKAGPVQRGSSRTKYKLKNGEVEDIYELILEALANDPPVTAIHMSELRDRVVSLLSKDNQKKPTLGTLKSSVKHLLSLMNSKETDLFKVFDLKEDTLHILDPQFLFYLRWGDRSNE